MEKSLIVLTFKLIPSSLSEDSPLRITSSCYKDGVYKDLDQ